MISYALYPLLRLTRRRDHRRAPGHFQSAGSPLVAGTSYRETEGSPKFPSHPFGACPALRPRWWPYPLALSRVGPAAFRHADGVGFLLPRVGRLSLGTTTLYYFGAQSHGLHPRECPAPHTPLPWCTRVRYGPARLEALDRSDLHRYLPAHRLGNINEFHSLHPLVSGLSWRDRIGTLILVGPPLEFLPYHRNDRFPRCTEEPVPGSRRLHAGCRPASKQVAAGLVPGQCSHPVSTSPFRFRHVISGSLSFVSLIRT